MRILQKFESPISTQFPQLLTMAQLRTPTMTAFTDT